MFPVDKSIKRAVESATFFPQRLHAQAAFSNDGECVPPHALAGRTALNYVVKERVKGLARNANRRRLTQQPAVQGTANDRTRSTFQFSRK